MEAQEMPSGCWYDCKLTKVRESYSKPFFIKWVNFPDDPPTWVKRLRLASLPMTRSRCAATKLPTKVMGFYKGLESETYHTCNVLKIKRPSNHGDFDDDDCVCRWKLRIMDGEKKDRIFEVDSSHVYFQKENSDISVSDAIRRLKKKVKKRPINDSSTKSKKKAKTKVAQASCRKNESKATIKAESIKGEKSNVKNNVLARQAIPKSASKSHTEHSKKISNKPDHVAKPAFGAAKTAEGMTKELSCPNSVVHCPESTAVRTKSLRPNQQKLNATVRCQQHRIKRWPEEADAIDMGKGHVAAHLLQQLYPKEAQKWIPATVSTCGPHTKDTFHVKVAYANGAIGTHDLRRELWRFSQLQSASRGTSSNTSSSSSTVKENEAAKPQQTEPAATEAEDLHKAAVTPSPGRQRRDESGEEVVTLELQRKGRVVADVEGVLYPPGVGRAPWAALVATARVNVTSRIELKAIRSVVDELDLAHLALVSVRCPGPGMKTVRQKLLVRLMKTSGNVQKVGFARTVHEEFGVLVIPKEHQSLLQRFLDAGGRPNDEATEFWILVFRMPGFINSR